MMQLLEIDPKMISELRHSNQNTIDTNIGSLVISCMERWKANHKHLKYARDHEMKHLKEKRRKNLVKKIYFLLKIRTNLNLHHSRLVFIQKVDNDHELGELLTKFMFHK